MKSIKPILLFVAASLLFAFLGCGKAPEPRYYSDKLVFLGKSRSAFYVIPIEINRSPVKGVPNWEFKVKAAKNSEWTDILNETIEKSWAPEKIRGNEGFDINYDSKKDEFSVSCSKGVKFSFTTNKVLAKFDRPVKTRAGAPEPDISYIRFIGARAEIDDDFANGVVVHRRMILSGIENDKFAAPELAEKSKAYEWMFIRTQTNDLGVISRDLHGNTGPENNFALWFMDDKKISGNDVFVEWSNTKTDHNARRDYPFMWNFSIPNLKIFDGKLQYIGYNSEVGLPGEGGRREMTVCYTASGMLMYRGQREVVDAYIENYQKD
jgi:hypothetical protein